MTYILKVTPMFNRLIPYPSSAFIAKLSDTKYLPPTCTPNKTPEPLNSFFERFISYSSLTISFPFLFLI